MFYASWHEYVSKTSLDARLRWCAEKAHKANKRVRTSPDASRARPGKQLTAGDVYNVMAAAEGRCQLCGSVALSNRPSAEDGSPRSWRHLGRHIGTLGHIIPGPWAGNDPTNLRWECLTCNTKKGDHVCYEQLSLIQP